MSQFQTAECVAVSGNTCTEMHCCDPHHSQVIALRLQGRRWSEIAHALGVVQTTVYRWRTDCPLIDLTISREATDFLESTRHALAAAMPKAAAAVAEIIEHGSYQERLAAAKVAFDVFGKAQNATPADVLVKLRSVQRLSDGELDDQLSSIVIDRTRR